MDFKKEREREQVRDIAKNYKLIGKRKKDMSRYGTTK